MRDKDKMVTRVVGRPEEELGPIQMSVIFWHTLLNYTFECVGKVCKLFFITNLDVCKKLIDVPPMFLQTVVHGTMNCHNSLLE